MAAGLPVVVTRRGGLPELVARGGGVVYEPGDISGLVQELAALVADENLCRKLSGEALAIAEEEFSPERHLRSLEDAYQSLCG
jgi:glycosyltransferase involved in cell wall biosynthesis